MVRNYGFENMNEFYLSYKESKNAYADYQQEVENRKKYYGNAETETNKAEKVKQRLDRLQKDAEIMRNDKRQIKDKGAR